MTLSALRLCAAALVVGSAISCGGDGPTAPVATKIVMGSSALVLDGLGATQQLSATVDDQRGAAMSGVAITWSSSDRTVAQVSATGLLTAVAKGTATITAAIGSISAQTAVTVAQTPTTLTKIAGDVQTGTVGRPAASVVVQVNDRLGNGIAGVTVGFAVTQGLGTVSAPTATTAANGQATVDWTLGTAAGTQTVSANVGSLTTIFSAVAAAGPAVQLALSSGNNQSALMGNAVAAPVVVKVTDGYSNPVPGVIVTFATTSGNGSVTPTSAATGPSGLASATWTLAATPGAQSMTAAVAGLTGSPVTFSATATQFSVTGIAQDTLVEGATITINGTGFSTAATNDTVRIDGVIASVTAASATQLSVKVPSFDCLPERDGPTTVTIGAATGAAVVKRIQPASFVNMAAGTQQILTTPSGYCLQFRPSATGGDAYVFGVGSAAELPSTQFGISVAGTSGAASVAGSPLAAHALPVFNRVARNAPRTESPVEREVARSWSRQYAAEARLRQWERTHLSGRPHATRIPGRTASRSLSPGVIPNVGDTIRASLIDASAADKCAATPTPIVAVVKAVGSAGIWATDVNNPGPDSLTDAEVRAYSDTFDLKIYAADTANFGAPSDLDANGRVVVIMTIGVNKESGGGLAGFVFSGDLVPPSNCAASNTGEYFYGNVPDPNNVAGTGARSHASVLSQLPSLIAHEFTHDIQFSRRLVLASGTGMNSWEAEGQAMLAQEVVGHQVLGNGPGNDYGFAFLTSGQNFRWYGQAFEFLGAYFGSKYSTSGKNANAPEQCSLFASTTTSNIACFNAAFYGASWSFQRYIVDRFGSTYPGGPVQLTRDVISKNVTLSGRANWQALLGLTTAGFDSLYAQWAGMLYADDAIPGESATLTMSSWNVNDILNGFGPNYELFGQTHDFSAFTDLRIVNGGGTAYTSISSSGAHPAIAIKVRDQSGNPLNSAMHSQLWIVRAR